MRNDFTTTTPESLTGRIIALLLPGAVSAYAWVTLWVVPRFERTSFFRPEMHDSLLVTFGDTWQWVVLLTTCVVTGWIFTGVARLRLVLSAWASSIVVLVVVSMLAFGLHWWLTLSIGLLVALAATASWPRGLTSA